MNLGISANINSSLLQASNHQRLQAKSQPSFGKLYFNPEEFRVLDKPEIVNYAIEASEILKDLPSLSKFNMWLTPLLEPLLQVKGIEIKAAGLKTPPSTNLEKIAEWLNPQVSREESAQLSGVSLRSSSKIIESVKKLVSKVLGFEDNKLFLEELENKMGKTRRVA